MRRSLVLVPLAFALGACATAPVPLAGEFSALTPTDSVARVRDSPLPMTASLRLGRREAASGEGAAGSMYAGGG